MGLSGAVVFNSAVDKMQQSALNLQAIRDARKKRLREDEMYELNKKKAKLSIEESELKGKGTKLENQILEAQMNEYFKQQGLINDGKDAMIDQAEQKAVQTGKMADQIARQVFNQDPELQASLAARLNPNRVSVPGPMGGIVEGTPEATNTPVAENPNPLELTTKGGKTSFDRKPYKPQSDGKSKPSYDNVLNLAKELAKDDMSSDALAVKIQRALPKAKSIVYGDGGGTRKDNMDQYYKQDTVPKKSSEKNIGSIKKVKVKGPDGALYMLPESQLEKAKAKGFKLAS